MPQISFPLSQAGEALTGLLADSEPRHLYDETDRHAAVLLTPDTYRQLRDNAEAFENSQEPREDEDLPADYRPYRHSPHDAPERLLPTEPLNEPLAHAVYGKPHADLTTTQRDYVFGTAVNVLLHTTLEEDTQGAVPILMLSHEPDDPEPRRYWQLAYKTDTPGLYLRGQDSGFFGTTWQLVTGSGLRLPGSWLERETAGLTAAALGRVLPYLNWMTAGTDDLTDRSRQAITSVLRRYPFHATPTEENHSTEPETPAPSSAAAGTPNSDQGAHA